MYQTIIDPISGLTTGIKRIADSAFIPLDPANTDYAAYLEWVAAGNTPLPADEEAQ